MRPACSSQAPTALFTGPLDIRAVVGDHPGVQSERLGRHLPRLAAVAVGAWSLLALFLVLRLDGRSIDDFFITYRYADQLTRGEGFVFNPGERIFGTTAPGHGLLLAALHGITGAPIPFLGTATTGVALVVLATLLAWSFRRRRAPEALLAGSWLLMCTYVWNYHGGEAPVALALLAAAGVLCRARPAIAGLLLGFAVWCRPETALAAVVLTALLSWEERRPPWRLIVALGLTVGLGIGLAWWWFGSPVPNTLGAKQVQSGSSLGAWRGGWSFWPDGYRHLSRRYAGSLTWLLVGAGLAGVVPLWRQGDRTSRPLVSLGVGLLLAYPLLGVPFAGWYAIPTVVVLIYGACFLAGAAGRSLVRRTAAPPFVAPLVAAALLVPLAVVLLPRTARAFEHYRVYSARSALYRDAALWIRDHSEPSDDIAYVEIGTIGYWSERPVRDLLGLIDPGMLPNVAAGNLVASLRDQPARFVLYHNRLASLMEPIRRSRWFQERYVEAMTFRQGSEELIVYRRGGAAMVTLVVEADDPSGGTRRVAVGDDGIDHQVEIRLGEASPTWRRDPQDPCFDATAGSARPPRVWMQPAEGVAVTRCRLLTSWGERERRCIPGRPVLLDLDPWSRLAGSCESSNTPYVSPLTGQWIEGWAEVDGAWVRRRLHLFLRPPLGSADPLRLRVRSKRPDGELQVIDLLDDRPIALAIAIDDSTITSRRLHADLRRDRCDRVVDKDDWVSLSFHPGATATPVACRYGFDGRRQDCSPQQVETYLLEGRSLVLDLDSHASASPCDPGKAPGAFPIGQIRTFGVDIQLRAEDGATRWTRREVRFEKRPHAPSTEAYSARLTLRWADRTRTVRQRRLTPGSAAEALHFSVRSDAEQSTETSCPELRDRSDWLLLSVDRATSSRVESCRWRNPGDASITPCPPDLRQAIEQRRPFALLHSAFRAPGEETCRPSTFGRLAEGASGALVLRLLVDGEQLSWTVPLHRDE